MVISEPAEWPSEVTAWPLEFWLSSRTESEVTDFDGQLRRCRVRGRARTDYGDEVLLADAEPSLPGQAGGAAAVWRRRPTDSWDEMTDRWLEVYVGLVDAGTTARVLAAPGATVEADRITLLGHGEAATVQDLLPPTEEAQWEEAFAALERFVAREGHARVPTDHREGELRLGLWVANQRVRFRHGWLPEAESDRLAALPGWDWVTRRGG